jgi:nitrogen regulatory protein P-II 1
MIERVRISIVCRDQFVEPTVKAIMASAHTGEIGDGRIFVSPVEECYSIRTGESGETVLRDKK